MRGRMRRPHVQHHLLALHVLQFLAERLKRLRRRPDQGRGIAKFNVLYFGHENQFSGVRTRGSRSMASRPPATVTNGPPSRGAGLVKATSGSFARFAGEREILAQREIRIAFPHQNPAQIRMTAEPDAHHVVDFAFMPVGRAPHSDDGRQLGFFLADLGFEAQFRATDQAAQMINDRPARVFAVIVQAADIHEVIEPQFLFGESAHFGDVFRVGEFDRDFTMKLGRFGD